MLYRNKSMKKKWTNNTYHDKSFSSIFVKFTLDLNEICCMSPSSFSSKLVTKEGDEI